MDAYIPAKYKNPVTVNGPDQAVADLRRTLAEMPVAPTIPELPYDQQIFKEFTDLSENAARALEAQGDLAEETGKKRKEEYYKMADIVRKKGEFMAKEASHYISNTSAIQEKVGPAPE